MNARNYRAETADAARDAIAFVLAVQRDDTEAAAVVFNNADPFDLAHLLALHFIAFADTMAASSDRAPEPMTRVQAKARAAKETCAFFESLQRDAARGIRTW
jgi:hypothetical protein